MDFDEAGKSLSLEKDEYIELVEFFFPAAEIDINKLMTANEKGDTELASDAAHSLKGAAGNLGFMELSDLARSIEERARNAQVTGLSLKIKELKDKIAIIEEAFEKHKNS